MARNLYKPGQAEPYTLSRSKIDLYVNCPRCFWLDARCGVSRPGMPAFSLNNAVDALLKKEFDAHRAAGTTHPYMREYGLDAVPYRHAEMDAWRDSLRRGIRYHYEPANIIARGGIDDVWVNPSGELIIVDYKATATLAEITLDGPYKAGYKRQMEVYQWLFRKNGFSVHPVGYFVFCNGALDADAFDGQLRFAVTLIPYQGDDSWVEPTLRAMKVCLEGDRPPTPSDECEHCAYRSAASRFET
ncbi:MAG TPA: PD-(D/E)XK nuclease family protein [Candidatus Paceibacterota bacterium]|nr:PD-(D/E)XK nuclease family protein [Candidatus Paceibacterota bacterium]